MHLQITDFALLLDNQQALQCAAFLRLVGLHMDDLWSKFASNTAAADAMTFWCQLIVDSKLISQFAAILRPIQDEEVRDNKRI